MSPRYPVLATRHEQWNSNNDPASLWSVVRYVCTVQNILMAFLFVLMMELMVINVIQYSTSQCTTVTMVLGVCSGKRNTRVSSEYTRTFEHSDVATPQCPYVPPNIKNKFTVSTAVLSWDELEAVQYKLEPGGRYRPDECRARHKVAIIIPFRDREIHLKVFLNNIHPFLQRQQIDYAVFIVELMAETAFNRAMLMNIGYAEAMRLYDYDCFVFHDVDLIPEVSQNMYTCPDHPRHMSVAIDKMKYKLPYNTIFGGVVAMTKEQFKQVNGFSNKYFGWGGEDDDMFNRLQINNMSITRYTQDVAKYKMLSHRKDKKNPERFHLLRGVKERWRNDGLNSLRYKVVTIELRKLYTYILVDINEKEIMADGTDKGKIS